MSDWEGIEREDRMRLTVPVGFHGWVCFHVEFFFRVVQPHLFDGRHDGVVVHPRCLPHDGVQHFGFRSKRVPASLGHHLQGSKFVCLGEFRQTRVLQQHTTKLERYCIVKQIIKPYFVALKSVDLPTDGPRQTEYRRALS